MSDLKKKLVMRCNHMGMRELDLLIGGFARAQIDELSEAELQGLDQLLKNPDQDIFAWVQGIVAPPTELTGIVARIRDHTGS